MQTKEKLLSPENRTQHVEEWWGPPGRKWLFARDERLHNFTKKIEGRRYVDGQYSNDWVQYL